MTLPRKSLVWGIVALLVVAAPALGADDPSVARLATCKDSWFDWQKNDPARLKQFGDHFRSAFHAQKQSDPFFVPKASSSIAGLGILQVYPESIGMAVGFSVVVDATFEKTKGIFERSFGRPLTKCEASDGMRTCELDIAPMRIFSLMAGDGKNDKTTLVGCYYFYEK